MTKKKPRCIICGRVTRVQVKKLPKGSIACCSRAACTHHLTFVLNDAMPIVWVGMEDIRDYGNLSKPLMTVAEQILTPTLWKSFGDCMSESLWNGDFGADFSEAIHDVIGLLEKKCILETPKEDLPLINIAEINSDTAKLALEARLKGVEPNEHDTL